MNFRQLETFLEIVRLGSFAAAANKLHATQSTVSARIQELESDLGVVLFDRSQRRATVTAKGRELLGYAERALDLQEEIRQQVAPRHTLSGVVRVGVAELVAMTWLARFAATIRERYPNISLELDIALTTPLRSRLMSGELDIAFIPGDMADPMLVARPLGSVTFRWMAGADFELPARPLVPPDFAALRILSLGENSIHYQTTSAWLEASGSKLRPDLCNSMSVVSTLTAAGVGISLLPPSCYAREIEDGSLRVLPADPEPEPVRFSAVYKRRRLATLQELIAETASEMSTFEPLVESRPGESRPEEG
ncbi:LysR family transcriptional regulator [Ancylobacter sp. MQZ15Z-1]|uniref:LysR family transcriptional regulator n=1 Tax=Ancylobacter mangrovi TaxID=2972472 RepID=A0A9X2T6B7_9HYPH|nr:LysR family transcriptional regulator [Ancylobacter mangrovi]MCS0494768.1 LysR family transcriptional regulator [Ancylobacter mangrovi]